MGNEFAKIISDPDKDIREDLDTIEASGDSIQSDVTALQADVTALQTDVTSIQTDVTSIQSDITAMQADVTAIQVDVATPSLGERVKKEVQFDGLTGSGEVGTVALFTVTGSVVAKVLAVCTETLTGATSTIEVGIAGNTASIIAQSTGTDIVAGEIWHDATPDSGIENLSDALKQKVIAGGNDIIATVATANVDDGTVEFYCYYEPISDDGLVVAA